MSSPLTSILLEVSQEITSLLLRPDQATFTRTCKTLNRLLTPVVWEYIELHHSGTHSEYVDIESEVDDYKYGRWDANAHLAHVEVEEKEYPFNRLIYEPSSRKYSQSWFNPVSWNTTFDEKDIRLSVSDPHTTQATANCNWRNYQHSREEKFVEVIKFASKERWAELAQPVR
jgi:hypothetical protein